MSKLPENGILVITPSTPLDQTLAARVKDYHDASKAQSTRRAYRADWEDFMLWCRQHGLAALPAEPATVAAYLSALADGGLKAATISRRAAAIAFAHEVGGHEAPTHHIVVRAALAGIRRQIGTAQRGKAPAVTEDIRAMVAALPETRIGVRDRALVLLGFAGAFRRSELVALDVEDLEECPEGLRVTLRRSKTDQEGAGRVVGIPVGRHPETCPVRALRRWQETGGIITGPLFRSITKGGKVTGERLSDKGVARAVKAAALRAGLDPRRYSGHSLRAGLATAAAGAGVSERVIMQQTGHKSERMVRRYIRNGNLFRENAADQVGL